MAILTKILNAAMERLVLDGTGERDLVESALRKLPRVVYKRLRDEGFSPGGIIDVGACEGDWTKIILEVFPSSRVLMIEARREQEPALKDVCSAFPNASYMISLLGRASSEGVPFHVSGTGSSIFAERSDAPKELDRLQMRMLDDIVSEWSASCDDLFLKLDVQGAEIECLMGGEATLKKTEVVQLEVALLNYNEGAPLAADVIAFMNAHGFAIFDIAGFVRPKGKHLVQIDIIFVKKASRLRPDFFHFAS